MVSRTSCTLWSIWYENFYATLEYTKIFARHCFLLLWASVLNNVFVQWLRGRHCLLNVKPTLGNVRHNGRLNSLPDVWGHHTTLFGTVAFWSSITFESLDENSDLVKEIAQLPVHQVSVWKELIRKGTSYYERSLATEATTRFLFNMKPSVLTELGWALYTGFILGLHFVSLRGSPLWQDA